MLFYIVICVLFYALASQADVAAGERAKKVFVHYLPWYDGDGIQFANRTGWCYPTPNGLIYNCSDPQVVHYTHKPLIGEYSLFDPHVLEYHLLLMHVTGMDGVVLNINPASAIQKSASLALLDRIVDLKNLHGAAFDMQVIVSYDDGGQSDQAVITSYMTWVYNNVYKCAKYSSLIFHDDATAAPVFITWSESDLPHYKATITSLFGSNVLWLLRNAHSFDLSDGNFEWIGNLNTGTPKTNSANWGQQYFLDFDWAMSHQTANGYPPADVNDVKMGNVYPGFDDENVSPFWGGCCNRYVLRDVDDGNTLQLTWDLQIAYQPAGAPGLDAVENPWVQIVTWNDWPEGSSVEPATADGYGYDAVQTCRSKIAAFKGGAPGFQEACLAVPFAVYMQRKNSDDIGADSKVTDLLNGIC